MEAFGIELLCNFNEGLPRQTAVFPMITYEGPGYSIKLRDRTQFGRHLFYDKTFLLHPPTQSWITAHYLSDDISRKVEISHAPRELVAFELVRKRLD